ncbi:TPA: transposase [Photobacterium damselae]
MSAKVTVETALNAELDEHLRYQKYQFRTSSNSRNGYSGRLIITDDGEVDIEIPRDHETSFEPQHPV